MNSPPDVVFKMFYTIRVSPPPLSWPLSLYTQGRFTSKCKTSSRIFKLLITITLSTLLHLTEISSILLMKQSSTTWHFQPHHSYPEPLTNPLSQFSSPYTQYHLTSDIRIEAHATTAATATASTTNIRRPAKSLSISMKEPSNFISTHKPDKPRG